MPTILIVEDDRGIHEIVKNFLEKHGYKTISAYDGASGVDFALAYSPDLVILDLNLPFLDGIKVAKKIKEAQNIPIIMLTARTSEVDELYGFRAGAVDYIKKPFSLNVLLARIKVHLRTEQAKEKLSIQTDNLTEYEKKLLEILASSPGKVFSREELLKELDSDSKDRRLIDAVVKNIRKKTNAKDIIISIRGKGYKINPNYLNA